MIHPSVLADEFSQRWERIRKSMLQQGADAMLVTDNVNLYYVSGRVFSGYCYLPADREPLFFVRRPVGLDGDNIVYIRKPEEIGDYLREQGLPFPQTLMLENDSITHNEFLRYEAIFKPATIKNGTAVLRSVRSIKTPYEIGQIRRSGILHAEVYAKIPSLYKKGMTDLDLSVEIERESRLLGSLGIFRIFGQSMEIFMGSVIAGDNADNPSPYDFAMGGAGLDDSLPVGCNGTMLEERMSVMVDLGGNFTGYMTDMTRVFAVGSLPQEAVDAHQCSIDICRAFEREARPGVEARTLYEMCADMARERGLERYFMGHRQHAGFVGHGVGIEVNEWPVIAPRSRQILERNNTIALEPKFVIPEVGAVGIENTYVIEDTGARSLTNAPEEIVQLI